MGLPPSVHEPQAVRSAADRILADARYDRPPESLPDRILGWFADQIASVIGSLVGGGAGAVLAWAFVLGAIAFVVVLVVRFGRQPRLVGLGAGPSPRVMVELSRSPEEWRREADRLAGEGRWREALRCVHRALVAELVGRGALSDQPGRTARELVRDLAATRPDAVAAFDAATTLFEDAWYGHADVAEAELAELRSLESRVLRNPAGAR